MHAIGLKWSERRAYASHLAMSAEATLPVTLCFWTWGEAIAVASRVESTTKARVCFNGTQWAVTYRAPLRLVNAS